MPGIARRLRGKNKPHPRRGSCRRRSTNPSSLADGAQLAQKRKRKGRFGVGAGLRGQVPDRPPILRGDRSDRVKPRSLIVLHPPVPRSRAVDPTQIGFLRCGAPKEKKKGQVRSWGGASRSSPRSAADPQGIGRTELSPARLSSYVLPPLAAGPSIHLRSGSYAARGLSEWGCPEITLPLSGPTRLTHRA